MPPAASEAPNRQSIPAMLADVAADVGGILRAEAVLGREEAAANARALAGSGLRLAAGLLMLSLMTTFGTVAIVVALADVIGLLWALLAVTALCLVAAIILIAAARRRFANASLLPDRSLARVSSDLERLSRRAGKRRVAGQDAGKEQGQHA